MAIALFHRKVFGRARLQARLLDAVVATGDGEWINVAGFHPLSFQISGITVATLELDGSNAPTRPLNSVHGFYLAQPTGDGAVDVDMPVEWVKARCTAYTSGTITVDMVGSEAS